MEDIQIGAHGHCAVPRVTMELKIVFAHAQIHRLQTAESNAQGLIKKHEYVETLICAHFQVFPLTVDIRSGASGLPVARHAQEELRNALVRAPVPVPNTVDKTAVDWD